MKCQYCGHDLPDNTLVCPNCGIEHRMFCKNCGKILDDAPCTDCISKGFTAIAKRPLLKAVKQAPAAEFICESAEYDPEYKLAVNIIEYTGHDREVIIPSLLGKYDLTPVSLENTFSNCDFLETIVVPYSVTRIGTRAFYGCSNLKKVRLPESLCSIGMEAFSYCSSLTELYIPENVGEIDNDSLGGAFDGCSNIHVTFIGKTYDYEHIQELYDFINNCWN